MSPDRQARPPLPLPGVETLTYWLVSQSIQRPWDFDSQKKSPPEWKQRFRRYSRWQFLSIVGTETQATAIPIVALSNGLLALAIFAVLGQLLRAAFSSIGGRIADRFEQRSLLLISNVGTACLALVLASLVWAAATPVWALLLIQLLQALLAGLSLAARGPLVYRMVPAQEYAHSRIHLAASAKNGAMIGVTLGAIFVAPALRPLAFLLDAFTYLPLIFFLQGLKTDRLRKGWTLRSVWNELRTSCGKLSHALRTRKSEQKRVSVELSALYLSRPSLIPYLPSFLRERVMWKVKPLPGQSTYAEVWQYLRARPRARFALIVLGTASFGGGNGAFVQPLLGIEWYHSSYAYVVVRFTNMFGGTLAGWLLKWYARKRKVCYRLRSFFLAAVFYMGWSIPYVVSHSLPITALSLLMACLGAVSLSSMTSVVIIQNRPGQEGKDDASEHIQGRLSGLHAAVHQTGVALGILCCYGLVSWRGVPFVVGENAAGLVLILITWYVAHRQASKHRKA